MAGIKGSDLIPDDLPQRLEESAAKAGKLNVQMEELASTLRQELAKGFAEIRTELKSVGVGSDGATKKLTQLEARLRGLKRTSKEFEKELGRLRHAHSQQSKQLTELREKYRSLSTAQSQNLAQNRKMVSGVQDLVFRYVSLSAGIIAVERGLRMFSQQIKAAVQSNISLEQAMKEVQAISRSTTEQLKTLEADANRLGATTEKTAQQVAGLQKELAKLGFSPTEIIAAADSIIDLSTATGEDLVNSATIAASTLRAFGLEATEMTKVVDVMAGSFVRSGLDLSKFRESMKLVAPIARAANIEIETVTGALSKLADAGLSGSLAGTALRNLISNMADPMSKLGKRIGFAVDSSEKMIEAFRKLRNEGVDLAEAVSMVDVRARPAFFTIMNNIDTVDALSKEYRSLSGEGERLATMMRDTLANDIEIANSAFDAMRRELVEGWTPALRELYQDLALLSEGIRLLKNGAIETPPVIDAVTYSLGEYWKALKNSQIAIWGPIKAFELLGDAFDGAKQTIQAAQLSEEFKRIGEEVNSSMSAVRKAQELGAGFKPLIDEFRALEKQTERTKEETKRMSQIQAIFTREFGLSAIAVDQETQELFLNTAELERQILAKTKEASTIITSNQARINEIKTRQELLREETRQLSSQRDMSKALSRHAEITAEMNKLNRELALRLPFMTEMMKDQAFNGWSVLTMTAQEYLEAQIEAARAAEAALTKNHDYLKAVAKLEEQRAKIALDGQEDEITRINLAKEYMNARLHALNVEMEAEKEALAEGEDNSDALRTLEVKNQMAREAILHDYRKTVQTENEKIKALDKSAQEARLKAFEETTKQILERTKEANRIRAEQEKALQEEISRLRSVEDVEYEQRSQALSQISANRVIDDYQSEVRYARMTLEARKQMHMQVIESRRKQAEQGILLTEKEADSLKDSMKAIGDIHAEQAQRAYDVWREAFGGLSMIAREFAESASVERQNELKEIEAIESKKMELAGDNKEMQIRAEYEASEAKKRIRREEAEANKKLAIFNIILSTAQGVMSALGMMPPNIPLAATIGFTGGIMAQQVAARELPAYAEGTKDAEGGPSIVGEEGQELVFDKKSGKAYLTPDKPAVVNLTKGSRVETADETKKILRGIENGDENRRISGTLKEIKEITEHNRGLDQATLEKAFDKSIKKIPVTAHNYDEMGYSRYKKRIEDTRKTLNKKHGIR